MFDMGRERGERTLNFSIFNIILSKVLIIPLSIFFTLMYIYVLYFFIVTLNFSLYILTKLRYNLKKNIILNFKHNK